MYKNGSTILIQYSFDEDKKREQLLQITSVSQRDFIDYHESIVFIVSDEIRLDTVIAFQ